MPFWRKDTEGGGDPVPARPAGSSGGTCQACSPGGLGKRGGKAWRSHPGRGPAVSQRQAVSGGKGCLPWWGRWDGGLRESAEEEGREGMEGLGGPAQPRQREGAKGARAIPLLRPGTFPHRLLSPQPGQGCPSLHGAHSGGGTGRQDRSPHTPCHS